MLFWVVSILSKMATPLMLNHLHERAEITHVVSKKEIVAAQTARQLLQQQHKATIQIAAHLVLELVLKLDLVQNCSSVSRS